MSNFKTCVILLVLLVGAYADGGSGGTFNGDTNGNGHTGGTINDGHGHTGATMNDGVSDADGPSNKGGQGGEFNNSAAIQIPSLVALLVAFAAYVVA